jgi:hypothetical protein
VLVAGLVATGRQLPERPELALAAIWHLPNVVPACHIRATSVPHAAGKGGKCRVVADKVGRSK